MEEIAIVILNWNGKQLMEKFLPSITSYSENAQIIIADNHSTDDSIEFLQKEYPQITIVRNQTNGGFAKGYNDALKHINAKYYLLLNNDVEVTKNWLKPLIEKMKDKKIAGCQPKILSYNEKHKFEYAGASGGFLDSNYYPFCRGRIFDTVEEDKGQYDYDLEVFWTSGACMLIRSNIFWEAGGFDEDFFAHMEEIDLCWRVKKLGYSFYAVSGSKVYHVGGGTLNYQSTRKVYLNFRNNLMMLIKNHQGLLFPKLFYRLCLDGIAGVNFLIKGQFNFVFAIIKAHFWNYRNLLATLKKRKVIQQKTVTPKINTLYRGNIIWDYFVKKNKYFSRLNKRLFE